MKTGKNKKKLKQTKKTPQTKPNKQPPTETSQWRIAIKLDNWNSNKVSALAETGLLISLWTGWDVCNSHLQIMYQACPLPVYAKSFLWPPRGKEWKNARLSIKVVTEMPEGKCVNVCGLKYTKKKNKSFKIFQQFSFLIYGRKWKGVKEKKSLWKRD